MAMHSDIIIPFFIQKWEKKHDHIFCSCQAQECAMVQKYFFDISSGSLELFHHCIWCTISKMAIKTPSYPTRIRESVVIAKHQGILIYVIVLGSSLRQLTYYYNGNTAFNPKKGRRFWQLRRQGRGVLMCPQRNNGRWGSQFWSYIHRVLGRD